MKLITIAILGIICVFYVNIMDAGSIPSGKLILNEASVWREYVMWTAPKNSPPPAGWQHVEFDDSLWMLWRRPRVAQNLKIKNAESTAKPDELQDTGICLYDYDQYGIYQPENVSLRCFRGRFTVEDPKNVQEILLSVEFRGGIAVYLNGSEIHRAYLPKEKPLSPDTRAEDYPDEAYLKPNGTPWIGGNEIHALTLVPQDPLLLSRFNSRIRKVDVNIPAYLLRKGVNVLALEIFASPRIPKRYEEKQKTNEGRQFLGGILNWSTCGLVSVALYGKGAIISSVERPKGLCVLNVNALTRITPFGGIMSGRIGKGTSVLLPVTPTGWGNPADSILPVRMSGARNSVCIGQTCVGSNESIKGINAVTSDLIQIGGKWRIPATAIEVLYQYVWDHMPKDLSRDVSVSLLDMLQEKPPAEVHTRAEQKIPTPRVGRGLPAVTTWVDGGADIPIWVKVRIPEDTPAGEYHGTLTIRASGANHIVVPIKLRVADYTLPQPKDFLIHVGAVHSVDTMALQYKVPLWSEEHWKLMEKTFSFMGELGGKVLFLPLTVRFAWFNNAESLVRLIQQTDSSVKYDFNIFDRYLNLAQKYLKPEVVCLCILDGSGVTMLDATGKLGIMPLPRYAPEPDSIKFWKPLLDEVTTCLEKRGLRDAVVVGLVWEGFRSEIVRNTGLSKEGIELFKQLIPNIKLAEIAHYGARGGKPFFGVPYGYTMSVWGNCTGTQSKIFGARDLPIKVAWHPRCDPINDIRPISHRGALLTALERAAGGRNAGNTLGLGPVGMDFWVLPDNPAQKRRAGTLEGGLASNLSMSSFTTASLLAPGSNGPVPTIRYEILRQALQQCEARMVIEKALTDPTMRARLDDKLIKYCEDLIAEREKIMQFVFQGEMYAQGEGWRWFEYSNWEERADALFECAGKVNKCLGK